MAGLASFSVKGMVGPTRHKVTTSLSNPESGNICSCSALGRYMSYDQRSWHHLSLLSSVVSELLITLDFN